jgi:flagellar hook-basal body complex protein FliE
MDSLGAIRQYAAQGLRSPGMMPSGFETAKPQGISLRDLEDIQGKTVGAARSSTDSFGSILGQVVQDVNQKQIDAANTVNGMLSGQSVNLHQAVIAMEEASVSFQLMVEVRNKLLESYQELMRMQV